VYHRLCNKLALDTTGVAGNSPEYGQLVAMNGGNAVQWEVVLFHLDRDGVIIQPQVSNDRENWADLGGAQTILRVGYKLFTSVTDVAAAYVRLRYSMATSGKAVLAAGINVSNQ